MDVDVLLFDVGGTVFDWHTAICESVSSAPNPELRALDADAFSTAWREQSMIECYEIAERQKPWRPFDAWLTTSLDLVLHQFGADGISRDDRARLRDGWSRMPVWPEVAESIERLRERFFVAPHTVLGLAPVAFSSKAAGLTWDAIISCDGLGATKTDPESYARALQVIGRDPASVCFVAAHPRDLRSAAEHGMRTAYTVARLHDYGDDYDDTGADLEFDVVTADLAELADELT